MLLFTHATDGIHGKISPCSRMYTNAIPCMRRLRCDVQWWDGHIHIPDVPMWALVAGGAGAGGLIYYYNFYKRGSHAHAEPWTGGTCQMTQSLTS